MTARVVGIKVCANEKMNVVRLQSDRTQTVDDKIIFGHFDSQTAVQFRRVCRKIKRKTAVNQNVRASISLNKPEQTKADGLEKSSNPSAFVNFP